LHRISHGGVLPVEFIENAVPHQLTEKGGTPMSLQPDETTCFSERMTGENPE
jgi:hypothetical protein